MSPRTFMHLVCTLFPQLCLHHVSAPVPCSVISSWQIPQTSPSKTSFRSAPSLLPASVVSFARLACKTGLNLYTNLDQIHPPDKRSRQAQVRLTVSFVVSSGNAILAASLGKTIRSITEIWCKSNSRPITMLGAGGIRTCRARSALPHCLEATPAKSAGSLAAL